MRRVPACSHERRLISDAVSTPPPGTIIVSVWIAACTIAVSQGPEPASAMDSSAKWFQTKRRSASASDGGEARAAATASSIETAAGCAEAARRSARRCSVCVRSKRASAIKKSPDSKKSLRCCRCLRPRAASAFSVSASSVGGAHWPSAAAPALAAPLLGLSGRNAVFEMTATLDAPRSVATVLAPVSVTTTSALSSGKLTMPTTAAMAIDLARRLVGPMSSSRLSGGTTDEMPPSLREMMRAGSVALVAST